MTYGVLRCSRAIKHVNMTRNVLSTCLNLKLILLQNTHVHYQGIILLLQALILKISTHHNVVASSFSHICLQMQTSEGPAYFQTFHAASDEFIRGVIQHIRDWQNRLTSCTQSYKCRQQLQVVWLRNTFVVQKVREDCKEFYLERLMPWNGTACTDLQPEERLGPLIRPIDIDYRVDRLPEPP